MAFLGNQDFMQTLKTFIQYDAWIRGGGKHFENFHVSPPPHYNISCCENLLLYLPSTNESCRRF